MAGTGLKRRKSGYPWARTPSRIRRREGNQRIATTGRKKKRKGRSLVVEWSRKERGRRRPATPGRAEEEKKKRAEGLASERKKGSNPIQFSEKKGKKGGGGGVISSTQGRGPDRHPTRGEGGSPVRLRLWISGEGEKGGKGAQKVPFREGKKGSTA